MALSAKATIGASAACSLENFGRLAIYGANPPYVYAGSISHHQNGSEAPCVVASGSVDNSSSVLVSATYTCVEADKSIRWRHRLNITTAPLRVSQVDNMATDSAGNIYIGIGVEETTNVYYPHLIKLDANGGRLWQRRINPGVTSSVRGLTVDSSGNVIVLVSSSGGGMTILKYNSSGTLQWQKKHDLLKVDICSLAADASGNFYYAGLGSSTYLGSNLIKFDSSGSVVWHRMLGSTSSEDPRCMNISPNGAYIAVGGKTTAPQGFVSLFDSSGNLLFSTKYTETSQTGLSYINGIAVDNSGDVYATSLQPRSLASVALLCKFNQSGTLLWARRISPTTNTTEPFAPVNVVVANGGLALSVDCYTDMSVLFLPTHGGPTGTIDGGSRPISYASTTITQATGPAVSTPTAASMSSGVATEGAGSLPASTTETTTASFIRI